MSKKEQTNDLHLHADDKRLPEIVIQAMQILHADRDVESLLKVCTTRMQTIEQLGEMLNDAQREIHYLRNELASHEQRTTPPGTMAEAIEQACQQMCAFLLDKNQSYGNSAAEPVRIFSKADPLEQIRVRIDDKLSRMIKGKEYPGDNDERDLTGYLLLMMAVRNYQQ